MSADLAAFIAARYDEAEALAKAAGGGNWDACGPPNSAYVGDDEDSIILSAWAPDRASAVDHAAANDPAHRLADIRLKRAILAEHAPMTVADGPHADEPACQCCGAPGDDPWYAVGWPCVTVRQLGTEFAEHEGYKQEWRPET